MLVTEFILHKSYPRNSFNATIENVSGSFMESDNECVAFGYAIAKSVQLRYSAAQTTHMFCRLVSLDFNAVTD